jgi:hypothetical protein
MAPGGGIMGPGPGAGRVSIPDSPGGDLQWRVIYKDPVNIYQDPVKHQ